MTKAEIQALPDCAKKVFCIKKFSLSCFMSLAFGIIAVSALIFFAAQTLTARESQDKSMSFTKTEFPDSAEALRQMSANLMDSADFAQSLSEIAPAAGSAIETPKK